MTTLETFKLALNAEGTGNDSTAYKWHTTISDAIVNELIGDPRVKTAMQLTEIEGDFLPLSLNYVRQAANRTATAILKQLLDIEVQA